MAQPFDPAEFIEKLGQRLVHEFEDASQAGTPGLIGAAKEHPARKQLERTLPGIAGVGSGIIIDSYGANSRQQDIVVFERSNCPIYGINDAPEATYYPCEGVIACGEVKSALGSSEIEDAFEKIGSVKRLRRYAIKATNDLGLPPTVSFRTYGSSVATDGIEEEEFRQTEKPLDQIFGFVLCGRFAHSADSMLTRAVDLWTRTPPHEAPNMIVSLSGGVFWPTRDRRLVNSLHDANGVAFINEHGKSFRALIGLLLTYIRMGRTVELKHFSRYLARTPPNDQWAVAKHIPIAR